MGVMAPKKAALASGSAASGSADPAHSEAGGVKRAGPKVGDLTLPASKRPNTSEAAASRSLIKPVLPSPDDTQASVRVVMKSVIPWVTEKLPQEIAQQSKKAAQPLRSLQPLPIVPETGVLITSYKEAWNTQNCHKSCKQSGMYEAAGNMNWAVVDLGDDQVVPYTEPSWTWLSEAADNDFKVFSFNGNHRIRFPVVLPCYWDPAAAELGKNEYPSGGHLHLSSGHGFYFAWYIAVFRALSEGDFDRVSQLYECSLTVTMTMLHGVPMADIMLDSILGAEVIRSQSKVLVDSFVAFAEKVWAYNAKIDVKKLQGKGVKFNGGLMNTTMAKVIDNLRRVSSDRSRRLLTQLDREFSMEVLSASYNKLRLVLNHVKADGDMFEWVLETMLVGLRRGEVSADDFKLDAFQKKSGSANFIQCAIVVYEVVAYLRSLAASVASVDEPLAQKLQTDVVDLVSFPTGFDNKFPIEGGDDAAPGTPPAPVASGSQGVQASGSPGVSSGDFLQDLSDRLPRGAVLFADLYKKLHSGVYQEVIATLAADGGSVSQAMQEMGESLGSLGQDLKEAMRALHAAESVVGTTASGQAPMPSLRDLVRQVSDGGDAEAAKTERQDVWKRAVAQRKKYVTLHLVKKPNLSQSYDDAVKRHTAFSNFTGKAGEKHRVFVTSADLLNQSGQAPWQDACNPDKKMFEEQLNFLKTCRGPCDVVMAWDGCQKGKTRRMIEDSIGSMNTATEVTIVYNCSWNTWVKKKSFFGSENMETGFVATPCPRNKIGVVPREGESSSHFSTLTGVAIPPRMSLPRVSVDDKAKVFPERTGELPKKWIRNVDGGVPMFWQESKSVQTWVQLLTEVKADSVIDLAGGAGTLGVACMQLGLPYLGMVGHAAHLTWLTNVLDRASLAFICQSGHFLYQEDLATHVKELFSDLIEDDGKDASMDDVIMESEEEAS